MTPDEIDSMNQARASLARQRSALARRIGASEVAAPSAAEDLTRILLAIEAVDRALVDAGRPYTPPEGRGTRMDGTRDADGTMLADGDAVTPGKRPTRRTRFPKA